MAGGGDGSRRLRGSGLVLLGATGGRSGARSRSRSAAGAVGGEEAAVAAGAVGAGFPR